MGVTPRGGGAQGVEGVVGIGEGSVALITTGGRFEQIQCLLGKAGKPS